LSDGVAGMTGAFCMGDRLAGRVGQPLGHPHFLRATGARARCGRGEAAGKAMGAALPRVVRVQMLDVEDQWL
jgi:hypothetical protein